MEARIGGGSRQFHFGGASDGIGKKGLEWDLNDWRWDGDMFLATPLTATPSGSMSKQLFPTPAAGGLSNSSSSCSEENGFGIDVRGRAEPDKRRRVVVEEDDRPCDEAGTLTLKLGGHEYPVTEADLGNWEGKNGKRPKPQGSGSSQPTCQVEGCRTDLSNAKDYHRRHKVCEMHAKATKAIVGNVMQRFCQQCSRFHLLQEFDEGKRSCRRRLAGHNRRRRKTHPEAGVSGSTMTDDRASSYLLITLLRVLSNLHSAGSDQSKDQDLLSHLLRNIASSAGSSDANNLSGLLQASQNMQKLGTAAATSIEAPNPLFSNGVAAEDSSRPLHTPSKAFITGTQGPPRPSGYSVSAVAARVEMSGKRNDVDPPLVETAREVPSQRSAALIPVNSVISARAETSCPLQHVPAELPTDRIKLKGFDLNDAYNDGQDSAEVCGAPICGTLMTGSPDCPLWMLQDSHQSSPPQTSGNSDSTSTQSLYNSNGGAQNRTDRIVFKLFGKAPNEFPLSLRRQVLDWLSHSPTDMESYIRPGCIILTIYLRLTESAWQELYHDLSSRLNKLLYTPGDTFWRTGWLCARVEHHIVFIYNGQVVLDTPLLLKEPDRCNILSITPIAVATSARVNFTVKGFNVTQSTVRLLCAFEGTYLDSETQPLIESTSTIKEHEGPHWRNFSCSLPNAAGRGFIEVEDNGLSCGFFPFIVAEEHVCSEIRMLESIIDSASCDDILVGKSDAVYARNQAIDFLHEMGWLLRRSHLRSRSKEMKSLSDAFPLRRFRWLMSFAMDWEWCSVIKKLLDILFQGNIELEDCTPVELALSENLLHKAVRKNCKSMVESLLRYTPETAPKETSRGSFLFKPDMLSSSNITPLHIAASVSGAEEVLDALTSDPEQLGMRTWNSVRDSSGFTPEDYARSRGFDSYIDLVQKKTSRKLDKAHVAVDIPGNLLALGTSDKQQDGSSAVKLNSFQIDKTKLMQQPYCRACNQQLLYRSSVRQSLLYRPVMLSLVGIAAVCVCVGLLLKGPPDVLCVDPPFRWELLGYGWI